MSTLSVLEGLRLAQVVPPGGGIASCAAATCSVYERAGAVVRTFTLPHYPGRRKDALDLLDRLPAFDLLHVEVGAGDTAGFWTAVSACGRGIPVLATIHDRVVVHDLYPLPPCAVSRLGPLGPAVRHAVMRTTRYVLLPQLVRRLRGHRANLSQESSWADFYLPHPRLTQPRLWREPGPRGGVVATVGFLGSWAPGKGLDLLAEAWRTSRPRLNLTVHGAALGDRFVERMRPRLRALPGVSVGPPLDTDAEVNEALLGMDAVVLPYTRAWSGSASGIAERAAELGVPIVASDQRALRSQLGSGALWVQQDDPRALASVLAGLANRADDLARMAASARAVVTSGHERLPGLLAEAVGACLALG